MTDTRYFSPAGIHELPLCCSVVVIYVFQADCNLTLRLFVRPGSSDAAANCDTLVIVFNIHVLRLRKYRFIK